MVVAGGLNAITLREGERVSASYAGLKAMSAVTNHSPCGKVAFAAGTAFPPLPEMRRLRRVIFGFGPRCYPIRPYDGALRMNAAFRIRNNPAHRTYGANRP